MHFITFCWGHFSLYALILLWQRTAVNLHVAHKKTDWHAAHEALLACFLLSCITNNYSYTAHKNSSCAVHESLLACSPFRITLVFWLETRQKLKNTRVFTAHECKLRLSCTVSNISNAVLYPNNSRDKISKGLEKYNTIYVVYLVVILIWQLGKSCKDFLINCMPLSRHKCMSFSPYSTETCQFKIPLIVLFEQITKYSTCQ